MTVADNLRALVSELRPLIDERLDIDERISEIRGPASDKGLDFSQAKSLVIALARDSRDGGERVAKLTAKADNASWYADMLKSPTMAETSNNSPQSPADKSSPPHSVASPSPRSQSDGAAVSNRPADPSDTAASNSDDVTTIPLKQPEHNRADKRDVDAPRSPTKRPAVHGNSEGENPSAPATLAESAASNSEIEVAARAGPHLNGRIEPLGNDGLDAPSSVSDEFNDIPLCLRRTADGGFVQV